MFQVKQEENNDDKAEPPLPAQFRKHTDFLL